MAEKRYYWLKLPEDFFGSKELKKLRRIAGGDTYTVIYLKMLLASIKNEGKIYFTGLEDSAAEEIALEIDEDPENVAVTVNFLVKYGLAIPDNDEIFLSALPSMVGSESSSARRVREHRERKSLQCNGNSLQSNIDVTMCNTEKRREDKEINKRRSNKFCNYDQRGIDYDSIARGIYGGS